MTEAGLSFHAQENFLSLLRIEGGGGHSLQKIILGFRQSLWISSCSLLSFDHTMK